jgi:hypothetical protein
MAMRIAALVIYQVVTLSGKNIFQLDCSGLCSKVLGILNFPTPLTELPVHSGHRITGGSEATVVTNEELCRSISCQSTQRPANSLVAAGECSVSRRPSIAIHQQFHFALLENCSFFSHLVLRCLRGEDGSLCGVAAPKGAKPRPVSEVRRGTRPIVRSCLQQELQDRSAGALGASFPKLETLWVEVASRSLRVSVCEGGKL